MLLMWLKIWPLIINQNPEQKKTPNKMGVARSTCTKLIRKQHGVDVQSDIDALLWHMFRNTALHLAVFAGRTDLVILLVDNGADVSWPVSTLVHVCKTVSCWLTLVICLVLQAGANVWVKNKDDHTPLDTAAMYNKKGMHSRILSDGD